MTRIPKSLRPNRQVDIAIYGGSVMLYHNQRRFLEAAYAMGVAQEEGDDDCQGAVFGVEDSDGSHRYDHRC